MGLFYFDEVIKKYESELNFTPIINHLEFLYTTNRDILLTLIGDCWLYLVEGDVNQLPVDYDWNLYQSKLKYYIETGLERFSEDDRFCYVVGYVLSLHWTYVGDEYEETGMALMKKCLEVSRNENLKLLAQNFIDNCDKKGKYRRLNHAEIICNELFPSASALDGYFREIFISKSR